MRGHGEAKEITTLDSLWCPWKHWVSNHQNVQEKFQEMELLFLNSLTSFSSGGGGADRWCLPVTCTSPHVLSAASHSLVHPVHTLDVERWELFPRHCSYSLVLPKSAQKPCFCQDSEPRPSPFSNEAVPTLFAFVYLRHSWIRQHLGWDSEACPFTLSASDPRTIRPFSRFAPPSPLTVLQVIASMHEPKIQACFVTANQKEEQENRLVFFDGCLKALLFLWKSAFPKILKRTERECCIAFPLAG